MISLKERFVVDEKTFDFTREDQVLVSDLPKLPIH